VPVVEFERHFRDRFRQLAVILDELDEILALLVCAVDQAFVEVLLADAPHGLDGDVSEGPEAGHRVVDGDLLAADRGEDAALRRVGRSDEQIQRIPVEGLLLLTGLKLLQQMRDILRILQIAELMFSQSLGEFRLLQLVQNIADNVGKGPAGLDRAFDRGVADIEADR